ncbi:type II toxin-antitoxin system VapC family toxin [Longimicrobium sp.]|uniref:type II toxin-antitoxin system VapC family toxin n=1 Tax=Longimicrobium sp. TaxID=2029185 RepID=UPI002E3075A0|nr:type II toxin-antitoxin system VapC family toxin [Longimicrobium sp.]HEX6040749.1 type II toxin-antitoxin system VapC family toxin [Longimicrobium sp.]
MKYCFLDTSAFTKLHVVERGMDIVRELVRSADRDPDRVQVLVCDFVLPEAVSAVMQVKERSDAARRGMSAAALQVTLPRIRRQLQHGSVFVVIPATGCMELAADLVERHRLRGADSVQLAAALKARGFASEGHQFIFVSDDVAQCRAAEGEGLEVLRPAA